jgi:hypothetical protein
MDGRAPPRFHVRRARPHTVRRTPVVMFDRLNNLFWGRMNQPAPDNDGKAAQDWYAHMSKLMEDILGREHDTVMHAIIPYAMGGGLDLYYFPHGVPGTAIATRELSALPNHESSNRGVSCYELAIFTRHPLNLDEAKDRDTLFGKAHSNTNGILNHIAPYSESATLTPKETCEFPADMDSVGRKCLTSDAFGSRADRTVRRFGILAILEVFRSEMDFAQSHGGSGLIARLKASEHYPYSDLDREPVA